MFNALFINPINQYLHPSSFEVIQVADLNTMTAYMHAPYHPTLSCVDSLTTATTDFGTLDFWFAFRPGSAPRDVNRPATELFRFAAGFTPRTVPLLRGRVILTSHDSDGGIAGLTDQQIRQIALYANRRDRITALNWRYAVDARAQRRHRKAARVAQKREFWANLPTSYR